MEDYTIQIDPRLYQVKGLSATEVKLLALIMDFTSTGTKFTLKNKELVNIFGYKNGPRQLQYYLKKLEDEGIIQRELFGFYNHSKKSKSGFEVRREIKINYEKLEEVIDGK